MYEQGYQGQDDKSVFKGDFQNQSLDSQNQKQGGQSSDKQQDDENLRVINEVYQNAVMGKQSISNIITKIDNEDFKKEVMKAYENYEEICSKASMEIMNMGERPREKNPFTKAMLWGMINVSTIVDDSSSNLANIIIKGCNNSKNKITKVLNQSSGIDEKTQQIADDYLKCEQQCMESMQKFL
jgi:predicted nucleic acid-binding Zn ribbon protein